MVLEGIYKHLIRVLDWIYQKGLHLCIGSGFMLLWGSLGQLEKLTSDVAGWL